MIVAVTSLCEFAARQGDLDYRYTPAPTAVQGVAGHARVRRRRGASYQAEYKLEGACEGLQLSGRADGYDAPAGVLEEIKTHRGDLARQPEVQRALHWAQLRSYGALLCRAEGLAAIELKLTYFDVVDGKETSFTQQADAGYLEHQLSLLCRSYQAWHKREMAHRERRDKALKRLVFPHEAFRRGQRELSESVFKTICLKQALLLQAPTGLGKTMGTLFPALMAMAHKGLDRVFYLTSRNPVRQLALDGLLRIVSAQARPIPLRVIEFSARTQSCEHPQLACHGESCPLAKGFFDRLPEARLQATEQPGILDQDAIKRIALSHQLCPYFLAQELTRWADVVIADVNRFFDQQAILHALTRQNHLRVVLLLDEGHNLVDRARSMYSAGLSQKRVLSLKKTGPEVLRQPLQGFARKWTELLGEQGLTGKRNAAQDAPLYLDLPPASMLLAAQRLAARLSDYLTEQAADAEIQELLFELHGFIQLAESFADHSLCELSRPKRGRARLAIHNLIPADFLAPRFAAAHSSVVFSATLSPAGYFRDLLGLDSQTHWQEIDSPFTATQLRVELASHISTRLKHRAASITPIVRLICSQYLDKPANYLAYFSSFAYLEAVYAEFVAGHPDIPVWRQRAGMSEAERGVFVDRFEAGGRGIGFAVLGGAFAEGIDLPGSRLYGVFIASLGLPPFDPRHQLLSQRLQQYYGRGYAYTYLYPGLQKVSQAAGRVIRSPEDQGIVVLIDDRYTHAEIRALLPRWWRPQ